MSEESNRENQEFDSKSLAEEFAQAIVRKNVSAVLQMGTKINGVEEGRGIGNYDYGPDKILGRDSFEDDYIFLWLTVEIHNLRWEMPELINTHMLAINPKKNNEKNKIVTMWFFQDNKVDPRGYTEGKIQYEFSNEDATRFTEEVSKNPDLLEEFYQKTFNGLDSTDEHPGLRRVKADGFYLIPLMSEFDREKIKKIINGPSYSRKNEIKEFFNNLKKYHYKNGPYGSGEPFNPNH